jgi:pimeloyl-ACP methyl ester carboxylesterase
MQGNDMSVAKLHTDRSSMTYQTLEVDGLNIFYRQAGNPGNPALLLLHGFPSSSRMYETLMPLLADRYHVVAPDYPGFGLSDAPSPDDFAYTFDALARYVAVLTEELSLKSYYLYLQDYGGPVGFRIATAHPDRVLGIIVQNAVIHEEGLSGLWEPRRRYWANPLAETANLRANFTSLDATRIRHVGNSPNPERYDPDLWMTEYAFLTRRGQDHIQSTLFYDYRNNVALYGAWQAWLREFRPKLLVIWGRYDPSFTIEGALAYKREVPNAEVHIIDAGHFALDEANDCVAILVRSFLARKA